MEIKLLEIRDSGTMMPCMAVKLSHRTVEESWLLRRAGFGYGEYVLFHPLTLNEINYDVYSWRRGARTVPEAHKYVLENWDNLKSGDVVDVEFILKETEAKKVSERLS